MASESLTQRLCELLQRPIGQADRQRARQHLLDWFACARYAAGTPQGRRWVDFFSSGASIPLGNGSLGGMATAPPGSAGLDGSGNPRRGSAAPSASLDSECPLRPWSIDGGSRDLQDALQLNAALGNIGELDDVHRIARLHPGPIVIPVAIAAAVAAASSLDQCLDAMVRGYETAIRVGEALGAAHYRFHHSTATAGALGAASAAASVGYIPAARWAAALGHAGSVTGGLWQLRHETTDSKQWHSVHAAWVGWQSARMGGRGLHGPLGILDGPQGMLQALSDGGSPEAIATGGDDPWRIHECSIKPWPACRHAHPAIDAALQARGALATATIEGVAVETYGDAIAFCDRPKPRTAAEAQFSLQYCVAAALLGGAPTLADFAAGAWERDAHRRLAGRVTVVEGAAFSCAYPDRYGARVTLRAAHGAEVSHAVHDTLGDPARPLDADSHLDKLQMLLDTPDRVGLRQRVDEFYRLPGSAGMAAALALLDRLGAGS